MITQSVPLMIFVLLMSYHSGEYHVMHLYCVCACARMNISYVYLCMYIHTPMYVHTYVYKFIRTYTMLRICDTY